MASANRPKLLMCNGASDWQGGCYFLGQTKWRAMGAQDELRPEVILRRPFAFSQEQFWMQVPTVGRESQLREWHESKPAESHSAASYTNCTRSLRSSPARRSKLATTSSFRRL